MVIKKHLIAALDGLEFGYMNALNSPNYREATYFCKLATLEYCGWIEETFDQIVRRAVKGRLKSQEFTQMLNSIIDGTYGFDYKKHFRPMMSRVVGLRQMEALEISLNNSGKLSVLISELDSVKVYRNSAAHTWIRDATRTYPAPSVIKSQFLIVFPIVKEMHHEVIRLC